MNENEGTSEQGLAWDWWKDPPKVWKDPKNFVMTKGEVIDYHEALLKLKAAIDAEIERVLPTRYVLEKGRAAPSYRFIRDPKPVTLCSWLQLKVELGKAEIALLQFSVKFVASRVTTD